MPGQTDTLLSGTTGGGSGGYGQHPKADDPANRTYNYDPNKQQVESSEEAQRIHEQRGKERALSGEVRPMFHRGSDPRDMPDWSGNMTAGEIELQQRRDFLPNQQAYSSWGLSQGANVARKQAEAYGAQAQQAYGQQIASRGYTDEQLARLKAYATGQMPSITGMELASALAQSRAQASSMAAGARGGAGAQGAALRGAMYANAAAGQNIASEAAESALKERLGYEQALQQAASAQRQADLAARGQGIGAEAGMAGLSADEYKAMLAAQMQYEAQREKAAMDLSQIGLTQQGQQAQKEIAERQAQAQEDAAKKQLYGSIVQGVATVAAAAAQPKLAGG